MTHCLYRPGHETRPPGDGAPRGQVGLKPRQALGEYLDAILPRPLYNSEVQNYQRVETALTTMTQAERVYLEIEMQERAKAFHGFDYDPLR